MSEETGGEYLLVRCGAYGMLLPSLAIRDVTLSNAPALPLPLGRRMARTTPLLDGRRILGAVSMNQGASIVGWCGVRRDVQARFLVDTVEALVHCDPSDLSPLPSGFGRLASLFVSVWRAPDGGLMPCVCMAAKMTLFQVRRAALDEAIAEARA